MSQKIVGMILTAIALVLLVFFIRIELYFLLGLPIMLLVVGIIVTLSAVSGEASISSNETTSEETLRYSSPSGNKQDKESATVQSYLSPSNAGTKTDDGPISHDSEEYRRWKEGK